ncbi:hypothetical protein V1511DRAFT_337497 [Dipodascopsis uninucleata]
MVRLSARHPSISLPAPPQISQTTSSPVISSPSSSRRLSISSFEGGISRSQSYSQLQMHSSGHLNNRPIQRSHASEQPINQGILGRFSLSRTVSYLPFSSAILSSPYFPSSSGLGRSGSISSSSSSTNTHLQANNINSMTSTSSSPNYSSLASATRSTSTTSLSSLLLHSPTTHGAADYVNAANLQRALQKERQLREAAEEKFKQASLEIEDLSQTLFEEANNMVAVERRERAKVESKLQDAKVREQKLIERLNTLEDAFNRLVSVKKNLEEADRLSTETSVDSVSSGSSVSTGKAVGLSVEELAAEVGRHAD